MTFTAGVPFDGQSLGASKPLVRGNFTNYFNLLSVNHVPPNALGQGKHTYIECVAQSTSPDTTAGGEAALYGKTSGSQTELFCQKQGQIAGAPDVQLTRFDKGVLAGTNGFSFLPGGFLLQWGQDAFPGSGSNQPVTFPIAFSSACYNIQVTMIGFGNSGAAESNVTTGFTAVRGDTSHSGQQFWWIAIGT